MAPPITGTTEFMAKRIERIPSISALAATAVFIDKTDTKAAAQRDIPVVIYFFIKPSTDFKFSSLLNPEHMLTARKQFESGTKTFLEIKFSACAIERSKVFVENAASVFPDVATITQKVGTKA